MDPQSQFKERYENFIRSRQQPIQPIDTSNPHHPFNKFYFLGLLLGVFILLPGLFVILRNNTPQGTQVPAQSFNTTSETITNDEIYQELVGMTGVNAKKSLSNPELVNRAQKNILMRQALQKISSSHNAAVAETQDTPNYSLAVLQTQLALEKAVVSSRTVDYISAYVAPNDTYEKESKIVKDNFEYIRAQMIEGKTIKQAYSALVKKLGINPNYNLQESAYITKTSGFSAGFITALFKTKTGDITNVIQSNKTDFMVAKVTQVVNTKYNSLVQWENENL